jgi:hypothetical protein
MRRDITVTISAIAFAYIWLFGLFTGKSGATHYGSNPPLEFHLVFWPLLFATLRALILWFQTLIDAARPRDQKEARVGWIIGHVIFGPFASYPYYYLYRVSAPGQSTIPSEDEIKRRANEGKL